ncbi:hypothetical protein ACN27F_00880 [Solwaraspora sp. WMMB335]|uniref:hypothetical protein n=1 Tax=Solwaraspora sp. WMMB335 TaxID=3404118 RepID=UPI003B92DAA4
MSSTVRAPEGDPTDPCPPYRPGAAIWVHRAGAWRAGVVLVRSPTAVTIRYRVTGAQGTGVDTVMIGRAELAPRTGALPPPEPAVPAPTPGTGSVPSAPQTNPADTGEGQARRPQSRPAGRPHTVPGVVEMRVFVRTAGGRPAELPLGCTVDRRTGDIQLRLPDGHSSHLDLSLARAAGMMLHEAVLTCLDSRELRLWIQR